MWRCCWRIGRTVRRQGTTFHATPYAYVSAADNDGSAFWNAPFGALLDCSDVRNIDDLVSFWQTGRRLLGDWAD